MKKKKGVLNINRLLFFLTLVASLVAISNGGLVLAQTEGDPWSPPLNLSHSGSTSNPVAVRDAKGIIHVLWQDVIAGIVYTRLENEQWSQPVPVKLPFGRITPSLMADKRGFIHAFWINQSGSLFYARLSVTSNLLTGERPQMLVKGALAYDVAVDLNDGINLAYVSFLDEPGLPAGVYFRKSVNGGGSWAQAKLLYPSQYFRVLDKKDANVSIATDGEGANTRIYMAWDNRPRNRVFYSISSDNGNSWTGSTEIQEEDTSENNASPSGIEVGASSGKVLLLWQTGDPSIGCRQMYRWSADGGENWSSASAMPTSVYGCPQKNRLLASGNLIILMTSIQDQIYLVAWNGSQWSNPELQRTLTGFPDPETQEIVFYACQDPVLLPDGQMLVVGCDEGAGKDVWVTSRPISDSTSWFPPAPVWGSPSPVVESNTPISSLKLIADSKGGFHAIWTQKEASATDTPKSQVYYSEYDGSSWSRSVRILSSPAGDADQPSITNDPQDRLMVVWRELQSGSIYFSWAKAAKASSPLEWVSPSVLPTVRPLVSSPMIVAGLDGTVYVVFAIPINEERGVYITSSTDAGQTWSNPVRVVDAEAAGWEMVDEPQIAVSADGRIHVMWKVLKVIGENVPLGIYYARSEDNGQSWSQPGLMTESPVYWYEMVSSGDGNIQLVWQEHTFRGYGVRQQASIDGGQTWSRPATIADLGTSLVPASVVGGYGNKASLLIVDEEPVNRKVLKQWTWEGDKWSGDASVDLIDDPSLHVTLLSAALFSQGKLGVIYNFEGPEKAGGKQDVKLLYSERKVAPGAAMPTSVVTQVIQATKTTTPTEIATFTPEPTQITAPSTIEPTPPVTTGRSRSVIFYGAGIIFIAVIIVVGFAIRVFLRNKVTPEQ